MNTEDQIKLVDALWQQAKTSAQLANDSWQLVIQSQKALLASYRTAGFPYADATKAIDDLMDGHQEAFRTALEHLLKVEQAHKDLLRQHKAGKS